MDDLIQLRTFGVPNPEPSQELGRLRVDGQWSLIGPLVDKLNARMNNLGVQKKEIEQIVENKMFDMAERRVILGREVYKPLIARMQAEAKKRLNKQERMLEGVRLLQISAESEAIGEPITVIEPEPIITPPPIPPTPEPPLGQSWYCVWWDDGAGRHIGIYPFAGSPPSFYNILSGPCSYYAQCLPCTLPTGGPSPAPIPVPVKFFYAAVCLKDSKICVPVREDDPPLSGEVGRYDTIEACSAALKDIVCPPIPPLPRPEPPKPSPIPAECPSFMPQIQLNVPFTCDSLPPSAIAGLASCGIQCRPDGVPETYPNIPGEKSELARLIQLSLSALLLGV